MRPSRATIALAVGIAFVCAAFPGEVPGGIWSALGAINAAIAFALGLDYVLAPKPQQFKVVREHPRTVSMVAPFTLGWTVTNFGTRPLRIRGGDELAVTLGADSRRFAMTVDPMSQATREVACRAQRRGRYTPRELMVEVRGPLGLMWRTHRIDLPTELSVYPINRSRKIIESRLRQGRTLESGSRRTLGSGHGTEFAQLRDYSHDDQFGHIDWPATARRGKPVVRTFHPEENQRVILLVDSGRLMATNVGELPRFEHAIDAARAMAAVASSLGDRVGLISFDDQVNEVLPAQRAHAQSTRIVDALFDVHPQLVESDYHDAFVETTLVVRQRSLLVLLTELSAATEATGLFAALPILTQRHRVVIGCVRDPDLATWADQRPSNTEESFRSAAAAQALQERRSRLATAQRLGATVLDCEPGGLAGGLIDAYLAIKSQGGL